MIKLKKYLRKLDKQKLIGLVIILVIALIGARILTSSHAQSPYVSVNADTGTVVGPAVSQPCSGASDGNCVMFGDGSVSPPSNIDDTCTNDVTIKMNTWINALPSNSIVDFPSGACYLVSNSTSNYLSISGLNKVTFNGNNATFEQTSYNGGVCNSNVVQPILQLINDSKLVFNQLIINGPQNCSGASNEGDYGIQLGQNTQGSNNITFNGVIIKNTDGDGLSVLPKLGTSLGINKNITFENGKMVNIGYHGIVPEGVNGFTIKNNTFSQIGNFMDMEVDSPCSYSGPTSGCYDSSGNPTGPAQWNITIDGNTFKNKVGNLLWINGVQSACIPQKNISIVNNTLDSTFNMEVILTGSDSSACPQDDGLNISNNISSGVSGSPCGGGVNTGPNCAILEVSNYSNVTISNNTLNAYDGNTGYFANSIYTPCIALDGVTTANIQNNTCNNAWDAEGTTGLMEPTNSSYTNSGITTCGNTWWLTLPVPPKSGDTTPPADPKNDGTC